MIAVQWSAWLTHTRHFPPTLEVCLIGGYEQSHPWSDRPIQELHADVVRQQRVRANVELIEAREREERAEVQRLNAIGASTHSAIPQPTEPQAQALEPTPIPILTPTLNSSTTPPPTMAPNDVQHPSARSKLANTLPKVPSSSDAYEPQSWTPRARGRG